MSLIEQARELVRGIVSTDDGAGPTAPADVEPPPEIGDTERIRLEWDAQPHHP